MKITVLAGGTSTERDISIVTGTKVTQALRSRGHRVAMVDVFCGFENREEVSTEDEEQTVSAFKLEKDPPSPQPQSKPESKPKRRMRLILAAAVVVVVGIIVLAQTGMFGQSAITTTKDNVTYSLADETLTISGRGGVVNPAGAILDWTTTKKNIRRIVIEEGVTSIGNSAFYDCSSLTNVKIPDSVTSIGEWAFFHCGSLTNVSIPVGVTNIGDWTFRDCGSLTSVSIPASVTSIGNGAFSNCSSLNHIYYGGTEAQWNAIVVGGGNNPLSSATVHYNSQ